VASLESGSGSFGRRISLNFVMSSGGWMDRCDQVLLEDDVVLFVDDLILSQFKPIL